MLIVIDEVYYEYVIVKDFLEILLFLEKYKNIFVFRIFFKVYGLVFFCVGYVVG